MSRYEEHTQNDYPRFTIRGFFVLVLAAILFFAVSCSRKTQIEYVDREVVKYKTQIRHDTLINNIHDSIFHTIFQIGDTVYNTKYVEHIKYKDRIVNQVDTITRDSIQTEYKYVQAVKKETPKWCYYSLLVSCLLSIFVGVIGYNKIKQWMKR